MSLADKQQCNSGIDRIRPDIAHREAMREGGAMSCLCRPIAAVAEARANGSQMEGDLAP